MGHTHENVDQMFSKISTELKKANTYTINGEFLIIVPHIEIFKCVVAKNWT